MATRQTDHARFDRDRERYVPPNRRPRSRSSGRRDRDRDRDRDRHGERQTDRYNGGSRRRDDRDRFRDQDGARDSHHRDDRRERDSHHRRSRSPGRHNRSREHHTDSYRRDNRGRDDRDRRRRSPSPSRRPTSRGSGATTPDHRRDRLQDKKKDPEAQARDKKADRLAKLAAWKQLNAAGANDKTASPQSSAPATPTTVATSATAELKPGTPKAQVPQKTTGATEKAKQKVAEKKAFKLDESAAARPLLTKAAGKPVAASATLDRTTAQTKANGNIGSFGLKAKTATEAETETSKKVLLDDSHETGKRTFQALPTFVSTSGSGSSPAAETDGVMSDIDSDEDESKAQLQAQLEKRRAEMTNEDLAQEDTTMEEAPAVADAGEPMDVDEIADAEEDEVDPLDAFMADLSEAPPGRGAFGGQTMFNDELEPEQTSVEHEDILAIRAAKKKKKKEMPAIDHSKVEYEPFRRDFYTEPAEISQMTPEEVAGLLRDLDGIHVRQKDAPRPVVKWAQMGLLQATMDVLIKAGYHTPTPIQAQAIPITESGRDLIGVAQTGSGKTLAYGIPMIRHILDQRPLKPADGPIGLILAPTRELSSQIVTELKPFLAASNMTIKCAYGGPPISDHIAMLKKGGIHILVATAGRLIDLLQTNSGRVLNFKRVTYVVLDEADRMFDLGFEPQVTKILDYVRPDRQMTLFSATLPKNMQALARKHTQDAVEVTVGGRSKVVPEIQQIITLVPPSYEEKIKKTLLYLGQLFDENENAQVLIFTEKQGTAEDLLSKLIKSAYSSVNTIHGAKDQTDRNEAIKDFKDGVLMILIATSVAARGLDVPGLAMVFNFDCPTHLEDYVHRCGRTGRAGQKGTAITLIQNPGEERYAVHLAKALKDSGHDVPKDLQNMADIFEAKCKSGEETWYGGFGGKGLDRLDAARLNDKKREKRALKLEGVEASEDEEILPTKTPLVVGPATAANAADGAAAESADQPSWMKLLNSKIVVNKTERPEAAPGKPLTARERAAMAAQKVDGRLSRKGMIHAGQPIDNKGPDAGLYHSTIEINEFPQKARWAVTNRTNVAKILEQTGVSITTKGNYYAPGQEPGETDLPKLYILVEGDTENVVTQAMMEITRHLREGIVAAEEAASNTIRGPTGRYSVL